MNIDLKIHMRNGNIKSSNDNTDTACENYAIKLNVIISRRRKLDKASQISDLAVVGEIIVCINNNNPGLGHLLQTCPLEGGG